MPNDENPIQANFQADESQQKPKKSGPQSRAGKQRASANSGKHWIRAKRILPEESTEAESLRDQFHEDFQPSSSIEGEIVHDLVFNRLLKRRIDVAFTREFARAAASNSLQVLDKSESQAIDFWMRRAGNAQIGLRSDPATCIEGLALVRNHIINHRMSEALEILADLYGTQPTENSIILSRRLQSASAQLGDEELNSAIQIVDEEIEKQNIRLKLYAEIVQIDVLSHFHEPSPATLETLLRYRSANLRELKDLIDTFDKVRRLRSRETSEF